MQPLDIGGTDLTALDRLNNETTDAALAAAERVARLAARVPIGWPVGLEQELHRKMLPDIAVGVPTGRLRRLGVEFRDELRAEVMQRVPSEYGVISLLIAMDQGALNIDHIKRAIGLMGGTAVERQTAATTLPFASGHYTRFADPKVALVTFAALMRRVTIAGPPIHGVVRATGVYFATTLLHPFADGNGRAARALFQCVLKADLGMIAPLFPLGPLFERNKALLLDAKYCWQLDGDANPLTRLVTNCVASYCTMLESYLPAA